MKFSTYVMVILATANTAVTTAAVSRSVEMATPQIETTTPLEDLLENDKFKTLYTAGYYEKASSADHNNVEGIYPIQFTEWMYGYEDYNLYFYVWNQTQTSIFNLTSELNGVTIQDVSTGSYELYPISFVSKTGNQFYKYKLDIYDLDLYKFLTDTGTRQYSLGQLHLKKNNSSTGLSSAYPFGKRYIYQGIVADATLTMEEDELDLLSVTPTGGVFRSDSAQSDEILGSETEGYRYKAMAHNDLHYVYFNIPNEYLNEYGDVAEYHFSYYPVVLNPFVGLAGSAVSNAAIQSATDPNTAFGTNYYAIYQWLKYNTSYKFTGDTYKYGFTNERIDSNLYYAILYSGLASTIPAFMVGGLGGYGVAAWTISMWATKASNYADSLEALLRDTQGLNALPISEPTGAVSSKQMDQYINFSNLADWAYIPEGYSSQTFADYLESIKVEEHLRYNQDNYLLEAYDYSGNSRATNNFRDHNNGYPVSEDLSIPAISRVNTNLLEDYKDTYFLEDSSDVLQDFEDNCDQAQVENETPYIFRFAHTYSYLFSMFYNRINKTTSEPGYSNRAGTYEIATGIYNLVSLDLTFAKDGVETIMPICADPLNINPGLTPNIDPTLANDGMNILYIILAIIALIVAIFVFIKLLPQIILNTIKISKEIKRK